MKIIPNIGHNDVTNRYVSRVNEGKKHENLELERKKKRISCTFRIIHLVRKIPEPRVRPLSSWSFLQNWWSGQEISHKPLRGGPNLDVETTDTCWIHLFFRIFHKNRGGNLDGVTRYPISKPKNIPFRN